jgi:Putative beta-barrel porin-2, OmpL-like. bbp2
MQSRCRPRRRRGLPLALAAGLLLTAGGREARAQSAPPPSGGQGAAAPAAPEPAAAPDAPWYASLRLGAFVDAYASVNYRFPRPNGGANLYHPYTPNTGLSLAWFGLDASMDPEPVGFTAQLRLGPASPNLALGDANVPGGVGFLQNAYASWRPGGKGGRVTLIAGKFDTLYGAEVAPSQLNINYTRGVLYNLAQPFFHTGVRADIALTRQLSFKLMAVNGWNNTIDNNLAKSFGGQLVYTSTRATLSLGYLGGPEQGGTRTLSCPPGFDFDPAARACSVVNPESAGGAGTVGVPGANRLLRHLGDVVVDVKVSDQIRLLANATAVVDHVPTEGGSRRVSWYGASLALRQGLSDKVGVGARAEVLCDPNGQISAPNAADLTLMTGTLTFDYAPAKNLLIRLDNRADFANRAVFPKGLGDADRLQLTTTLGVVAMTN